MRTLARPEDSHLHDLFANGYLPCDEPPGSEEGEYRRWKEAGGVVVPQATFCAEPSPMTPEQETAFHDGYLCGLTAYAVARGDSALKSKNHLLKRLMEKGTNREQSIRTDPE